MKTLESIDISNKQKLKDLIKGNSLNFLTLLNDNNETILHLCK